MDNVDQGKAIFLIEEAFEIISGLMKDKITDESRTAAFKWRADAEFFLDGVKNE